MATSEQSREGIVGLYNGLSDVLFDSLRKRGSENPFSSIADVVVGIGVGSADPTKDIPLHLSVYIKRELSPEELEDSPTEIDGAPVRYTVTGTISPAVELLRNHTVGQSEV